MTAGRDAGTTLGPHHPSEGGRPSVLRAGLLARCPNCGQAPLFKGFLTVVERCPACSVDLRAHDTGDGPAVFIILILGFVVVGLALAVEMAYAPPLWVHALLWPPLVLGGSLGLLRPFKGVMVALTFHHRRDTFGSQP
jgi:uncharacterized protein (DUF983 family)